MAMIGKNRHIIQVYNGHIRLRCIIQPALFGQAILRITYENVDFWHVVYFGRFNGWAIGVL